MIRREFLAGLTSLSALAAAPAISFAQAPMNLGQQWDVIVIGSGLAGLSAALSASENGADRILVIEKLPVLGGHSRLSTGSFLAVSPKRLEPLGIHTSVDAVLEEMMEVGGGLGNKDLARLLLSESEAAMDWLETHGLVWNPEPYVAVGSPSAYAFRTIQGFTGSHYIFKLNQRARERGVRFLYDQPVTDLLQDPVSGNVNGVVVKSKNHEVIYIRGNAVVIATGGYSANNALCRKFNPEISALMPSTANPGGRYLDGAWGDALEFTKPFHAATVDLDKIQRICFLGGRLVDYTGADIYLNKNGLRFVNEGASHGDVLAELLKQPQRAMWVITDSQSKKGLSLENKLADGAVKKFDSLCQVAAFIGCPAETLEETVTRYNDFVLKGVDEDFGKKVMLQTISYPPFYVGQERAGVHYCCGGLKFNEKAQVLNTSEEPIAGLYVAGEASGGVHGKDRLGGIGLTDAVVFGRIAGREAALLERTSEHAEFQYVPPRSHSIQELDASADFEPTSD